VGVGKTAWDGAGPVPGDSAGVVWGDGAAGLQATRIVTRANKTNFNLFIYGFLYYLDQVDDGQYKPAANQEKLMNDK
jgi:hypothetical protein